MTQRVRYGLMAAGGAVGTAAAFLQTLEKITLLKDKDADLVCNVNSVFSCSNVLNAWQSSVFGFPNSLMCMGLFMLFTTAGLAGAMGGTLTRGFRLSVQAISLATLGFALWFLWQSTYVITSLCIFCLFCFAGLLVVNWGWLRTNAADLPIGGRGRAALQRGIAIGADTFGWILLALAVAFAMVLRFA